MKSPKEKAKDLVSRYYRYVLSTDEPTSVGDTVLPLPSKAANAKRCALETVDEISLAVIEATGDELAGPHAVYWAMVRREIEEL